MAGLHNRMWAMIGECEFTRRTYVRRFGLVWNALAEWKDSCSGCYEAGDYGGNSHNYPYDAKAGCRIGAGCEECGYTGKRHEKMWLPVSFRSQIALNVRRRCRMHRLAAPQA